MCNLDDILKTEIRKPTVGAPADKGMSVERLEFNTDVMFAVAKKMELPLDKTAALMRNKGLFSVLHRAYTQRHRQSINSISNIITKSLQES